MSHPTGECRRERGSRDARAAAVAIALLLLAVFDLAARDAAASGAANASTVLILDPTVTGGAASNEASRATALGLTVEVATPASWAAKTTADFATYRAIILGDPTCQTVDAAAPATANQFVWGPAITGNVIIVGSDPTFHIVQGGAQLTEKGIAFATADPTRTGAYITLSCYYHGTSAMTPVPLLDVFGTFTVTGVGCSNDAHIVASHPALAGLTDATIANWSCSVHEAFDGWPASFQPLAISRDVPSTFTASDGSIGPPYILASGEGLVTLGLSLTPSIATNPVGTAHTVTATLTDTLGNPVVGALIGFRVTSGPNTGAAGTCNPVGCHTNASGQVTFTYLDAGGGGTDAILAFADANGSGTPDVGERQVSASKTWGSGNCGRTNCNDGNPCTDDVCGSVMGAFVCSHTDNTAPCEDGHPCTTGDTCLGGSCHGGPPPNCDDTNPCTADLCGSVGGAFVCQHPPITGPCDDGNRCTAGDVCSQGTCVPGPPDPSACLDHYKCYTTKTGPFASRSVNLVDQFGTSTPKVVRPTSLCNPADKNGGGILDATTHLMCYQLREPLPPRRRDVRVRNQFGDQTLTVVRADSLCNPAEKNGVPSAPGVDHFKCYRVRGHGFVARDVSLTDQFETQTATLVKPRLLCNPVDKNGEGIVNAAAHLACYTTRSVGSFAPRAVSIVDQFAEQDLSVLRGECSKRAFLCVPSLKNPPQ